MQVKLKDILITIENGSRPKGGIDNSLKAGVPSIGGEHITKDGKFNLRNIRYVSLDFYASLNKGKVIQNDILIVKDGATTGRCAFIDYDFPYKNCAINEHIFILRVNEQMVYPKYLFYYFMSKIGQKEILKNFTGSAIGGINSKFINTINLNIPSIVTQKQIVSQLEKLEQLKEKRKLNIQRCDELIKSIFYEMFGDPIKNEKDWPKYKIEELCDTNSGGTPNRSKKEYYNGDIPWIKSGELNQGHIYSAEEYISKLGLDNSSAKLIPNNTVLLAMYGATAGKVGFLKITAATNQAICAISPKRDLNKMYLYFYLKTLEKQFINSSVGGGQPNISQQIIKRTDILVPPIVYQEEFAKKFEAIEKLKEKQIKSKEEIDTLFNCLMQKYFNGDIN